MLDRTNDLVIATPKKLRKGFAVSLGDNGYITFPTWLGGLIFQWGALPSVNVEATSSVNFPIAFPTACRGGIACGSKASAITGGVSSFYFSVTAPTSAQITHDGSTGLTMGAFWFSWGH